MIYISTFLQVIQILLTILVIYIALYEPQKVRIFLWKLTDRDPWNLSDKDFNKNFEEEF